MKRTLLIDADIFLYKACFKSEVNVEWSPGNYSNTANLVAAQDEFKSRMDGLAHKHKAHPLICLSDFTNNWRKEIYPNYKRGRNAVRRPTLLKVMRDWVRMEYPDFYQRLTLEADDVMGILATAPLITGRKLMVTIDKDLLQIPGYHINPDKPEIGVRRVKPEEGEAFHLVQTLTGDSVDNYPGCPGIGPKRAEKILNTPPSEEDELWPWANIVRAYEKAGLTEDDALLQARVAKILQMEDYDTEKKEVILWTP